MPKTNPDGLAQTLATIDHHISLVSATCFQLEVGNAGPRYRAFNIILGQTLELRSLLAPSHACTSADGKI